MNALAWALLGFVLGALCMPLGFMALTALTDWLGHLRTLHIMRQVHAEVYGPRGKMTTVEAIGDRWGQCAYVRLACGHVQTVDILQAVVGVSVKCERCKAGT